MIEANTYILGSKRHGNTKIGLNGNLLGIEGLMSTSEGQTWAMNKNDDKYDGGRAELAPVFHGLGIVGVSGKDIATALRISTASVSKWRNGHTSIPDEIMVFLTLLLGDQIGQAEAANTYKAKSDIAIDDALRALHRQEQLNDGLPAVAVREGARRYRLWWNAMRNAAFLSPDNFDMRRGASTGLA